MTKYYKTRAVTLDFAHKREQKTIVEVTITAVEPKVGLPSPTTFIQSVIVNLCIDTHLLQGMVQQFKNLSFSQAGHYIDCFQSPTCAYLSRPHSSEICTEKANIDPLFNALGLDEFEITASSTEIIRATCNEIRYGFNGHHFYLQAPDTVTFSPRFHLHFFETSQADYWRLL